MLPLRGSVRLTTPLPRLKRGFASASRKRSINDAAVAAYKEVYYGEQKECGGIDSSSVY